MDTTETKNNLPEIADAWKDQKDTGRITDEQFNKLTEGFKTTVADPLAGLTEQLKIQNEQNKLVQTATEIINPSNYYKIFLNEIQKTAPEADQKRIGFNTFVKDMWNQFKQRIDDEGLNRLRTYDAMQKNALQNEGTGSAGGLLVPTPTLPLIMEDLRESGIFFRDTTMYTLAGKSATIPTLITHPTLSYVAEGAPKPVSNLVFDSATLTLKKYACLIPFTDELIEDAIVDIEAIVRRLASQYYGILTDNILFSGDAQINGIEDLTTSVVTTSTSSNQSVTIDNLIQAVGGMKSQYLIGAKWYMSPSVWAHLHTKKGTTNDMYYLTPDEMKNMTLLGFPVVLTDSLPVTNAGATLDQEFIVFGNLKNVIVGVKNGMTIDVASSNVASFDDGGTPRSAFQDNLTVLRLEKRIAMVVPFPLSIMVIQTAAA